MILNFKNVFLLVFVCFSSKSCFSQTKEEEAKANKKNGDDSSNRII